MKCIDAELLRQEIVREVEHWKEKTANHYTIEAEARWSEANYILGVFDSLQQEQPKRPDFEDVDPKHLVHSHYTKVRETKTGRVFWAEYSSEAAEWYEAGTGKAYSISGVEIVKEQPEVDLEKVVMIDNVIMNMTAEGYNKGYKTRPFYEEVLRRFNARKE